jgi:hypothetical protein
MRQLPIFLEELSDRYLALHRAKEEAFWETRMGMADRHRELADAEMALKKFLGDPVLLKDLRERRKDASNDAERVVLDGWILMVSRNQIEDGEARSILAELIDREAELQQDRGAMKLGYTDPSTGAFVPASSVFLGNAIRTNPDPRVRRASFEGLRSIETFALEHGFVEILKLRNRFARRLGFSDFYDYKVWWAEGFDKATLFGFLDDLEKRTREKASAELRHLEQKRGDDALLPWNFNFHTWGSVQEEREPYFGFEDALERWVRTFFALGVRYRNALVTLDLLDRRGKYENGFMHGPVPAFFRRGEWVPAKINFTANAVPGQVGSGQRAAETLFHEGGHASHFANVLMDAPCFSQEYAPTSVALAETQSMFMDQLLEDADWQTRYAQDAQGRTMPFELIERTIRLTHPFEAQNVRSLLTVCYAEKALYETPDQELTPGGVLATLREVERRLVQLPEGCPRPTLAVPHLLSWEASGYYHGYVLAHMAVAQTRRHFFETYGHIVDNPNVGRDMSRTYWAPGNSRGFLELVEEMTGRPFSADALARDLALPTDEAVHQARERVERLARVPKASGEVELDLRLRVIDGAEVVVEEGRSPLEAARLFREWILQRRPHAAVLSS